MKNSYNNIVCKLKSIPLLILLLITIIASFGFVMMYVAAKANFHPWAIKQMMSFVISFIIMIIIAVIDIKVWYKLSYYVYFISLFLLIIVEIGGHTAMGATRWINLGFVKFQPSEIMKLSMILAIAKYFHNISHDCVNKIKVIIIPIIISLLPFLLIVKQPDLGTALILILISTGMFFLAGINISKFVSVIIIILVASPLAWKSLHNYQKQRIIIFLNPESDPLGSGYNILQSKIAVGSGKIFGKGFLQGSQSQLNFLPEHQTDFIFTMLCEETGLVGALILISLYFVTICCNTYISIRSKNHYGRLLAGGINILFFLHIFVNMAMVIGIIPVVGVPLPLISYGRTMMLTILISFGFIINVKIHSKNNINF